MSIRNIKHKLIGAGLVALAFGGLCSPAAAVTSIGGTGGSGAIPNGASFIITLPNYSVTDIAIFNYGSPFNDLVVNPAHPLTAATPGPTTLSETYITAAEIGIPGFVYTPNDVFLLGVASNLPGDAPGQQHLVVFANDTFANSAQSIAFGTLFPNTNETTLINDLTSQTNPGDIFTFGGGDALSGPNGSIAFQPGNPFEAVAFSGGQIIGSGTSNFTYAVPEPSTWAMLMLGFAALGFVGYRRNKAASVAA